MMKDYMISSTFLEKASLIIDKMIKEGITESSMPLGDRQKAITISIDPNAVIGGTYIERNGTVFYIGIAYKKPDCNASSD